MENFSTRKAPGLAGFTSKLFQRRKNKYCQSFQKFEKTKRNKSPIHFYNQSKPDKDIMRNGN